MVTGDGGERSWLQRLLERPAWKRASEITEEVLADFYTTVVVMVLIYLMHVIAARLGFERTPIGFGYHMADIFTALHVCNIVINGLAALYHLALLHLSHRHRSRDE